MSAIDERQIDFCTLPELRALLKWAVHEKRDDFASRISDRMIQLHQHQSQFVAAGRFTRSRT